MKQVISIYRGGQEIDLENREYKIDVLGGWGVELGQFSIIFIHSQSGQAVNCERYFWRVQSFTFDKRAKRVFKANIVEAGTYTVEFKNPETLKVKYSNLFCMALFKDPIPNDKISIYIH